MIVATYPGVTWRDATEVLTGTEIEVLVGLAKELHERKG